MENWIRILAVLQNGRVTNRPSCNKGAEKQTLKGQFIRVQVKVGLSPMNVDQSHEKNGDFSLHLRYNVPDEVLEGSYWLGL